ncbi:alpha/beta hydrolase [Actinoplanes sp. NPDC051851]|uniref:alpha/beta hydrolase n=1 Tax=Actinoplanes sp. NPDC051851 TaxID=3154753 RepID=UPI0034364C74
MTELDDAARRLAEGALHPPYLYAMGPDDARLALDMMQSPPADASDIDHRVTELGADCGHARLHILAPRGALAAPVILYAHGGGWVLGGWSTHHRVATSLCRDTGAIVVMPEYSRVPEARYPVAITQLSAALEWTRAGGVPEADTARIALAGDCAGATLALSVALIDRAPRKDDPPPGRSPLVAQVLLYPLGLPDPADRSAVEFATGAALRLVDVRRLCKEYAPREEPRADPLNTTDVAGLPPTLLITAEADVTRDLSERFGERLRAAGVRVTAARYLGTVHDFAVLDALRWTPSARSARKQVAEYLRTAFAPTPAGAEGPRTEHETPPRGEPG